MAVAFRVVVFCYVVILSLSVLRALALILGCVHKLRPEGMQCLADELPYGMRVNKVTVTDHFVVYISHNGMQVIPTHEILNVTSAATDVATTAGARQAYGARAVAARQRAIVIVTRNFRRHRLLLSGRTDWKQMDELIKYIYARKPQYPAGGPGAPYTHMP